MRPKLCLYYLFLLFTACIPYNTRETLDQAEALLSVAPDSSLSLLKNITPKSLPSNTSRARHALLTTMAQDKCYIDIAEDSTILVAYNWYRRFGNSKDFLRSSYYLGIVRQNSGSDIDAAFCFRDAERLAQRLHDYRLLSLCEQHLSAIYAHNYDQIRAMSYAQKSLTSAIQSGDSLMAGYCRLDIAKQYISENNNQEAIRWLKQLLDSISDSLRLYSYANRTMAKAFLNETPPDYSGAQACYEDILRRNAIPLSGQDCGHLAILFAVQGNYPDADKFLNEARQRMASKADSVVFYSIAHDVFQLRGNDHAANEAYGIAMELQNQVVSKQLEQSVTHAMETRYLELSRHEQERNRYQFFTFILIGLLLVAAIIWYANRFHQAKQEIVERMAQVHDFKRDLDHLKSRDSDSRMLMEFYSQNTIDSLNDLAKAYYSWDSEHVRQKELRTGRESKDEMMATFRKQLEGFRKDKLFYSALEQSLNVSDNGLMIRAREVLNTEKKIDYDLLVLFFYGFTAKSICFLKGMSEASVRMRKTRMKQFFASLPDNNGEDFVKKLEAEP